MLIDMTSPWGLVFSLEKTENPRKGTRKEKKRKPPIISLYQGLRMLRSRAEELKRAEGLASLRGKSPFLLLRCSRRTWLSYLILANSTKSLLVNQPTNKLTKQPTNEHIKILVISPCSDIWVASSWGSYCRIVFLFFFSLSLSFLFSFLWLGYKTSPLTPFLYCVMHLCICICVLSRWNKMNISTLQLPHRALHNGRMISLSGRDCPPVLRKGALLRVS